MATKFLGPFFDIHGGGVDLIFPHHTFESMLGREFYGTEFARIYMHNGFVYSGGRKMSKSLGNVIKIRDMMRARGKDEVRYFLLKEHYRSNVAYSEEAMDACAKEYGELRKGLSVSAPGGDITASAVEDLRSDLMRSLSDDFDTGRAVRALLDFSKSGRSIRPLARKRLDALLREAESIFGYKLL
jgi:cysteinyl-tRNA synthetase